MLRVNREFMIDEEADYRAPDNHMSVSENFFVASEDDDEDFVME